MQSSYVPLLGKFYCHWTSSTDNIYSYDPVTVTQQLLSEYVIRGNLWWEFAKAMCDVELDSNLDIYPLVAQVAGMYGK